MRITAAMVKELRERTGAGMMDCKRALTEAEGDLEKAIGIMRLSGQAKADKKAGRITAEGVVAIRTDDTGRRAAMVEINCETDFVAKEAAFRGFVDAVCARVLAAEPDDLDGLARQTDYALDEVSALVSRGAKDDDFAAYGRMENVPVGLVGPTVVERERVDDLRRIEAQVDELVDDQVLVLIQRGLHARPLDLVVLDAQMEHHEDE